MQILLEATKTTPKISFSVNQSEQYIEGVSIPSDAFNFYMNLNQFVESNKDNFQSGTKFIFKLHYFNTASSKALFNLLKKITEIKQSGTQLEILWMFEEEDDFMFESGSDIIEIIGEQINLVKVSDN